MELVGLFQREIPSLSPWAVFEGNLIWEYLSLRCSFILSIYSYVKEEYNVK